MATVQDTLYTFPLAPSADAVEWDGAPIGRSNVTTRTRSRTLVHDKTVDKTPGRREHLVNAAIAHIVCNAGREPIGLHDVVIHGIRVRAITNSRHLMEFWQQNWYTPEEWHRVTGIAAPVEPQILVYALGGVEGEAEAAYYSRQTNTIVFFNTSYYGQLKSWVLGAVGRVLAADYGIHSIHGACVERNGNGVLYIAPTGTGKSTSSYGLVDYPGTRFHSDDWVYIRYARVTKDGQRLLPVEIQPADGTVLRGYRCNRWFEQAVASPAKVSGVARCFDLQNREVTVDLTDFDLQHPAEAYAYTSEKVFYLRSNLVENFPEATDAILRSHLENVPSATAAFLESHRSTVDAVTSEILRSDNPGIRQRLTNLPPDQLRSLVASLFAFDNARAMLDIGEVLDQEHIFTNPMEPTRLTTIFLLKRDPSDSTVLQVLSLDRFMERLLIGQTPDGKREVAYNAYRAVDDTVEKRAIEQLEAESKESDAPMYELFQKAQDLPESLHEEFELFREMHRAALCYDCNTILQKDPQISSKKEAVRLTLQLILRGIENRDNNFHLTLSNYRTQIRG